MTMHNYHESAVTHVLYDGCERCEEIARKPFINLGRANMRQLVELMLQDRYRYGDKVPGTEEYLAENEVRAMNEITYVMRQYEMVEMAIGAVLERMTDGKGGLPEFPMFSDYRAVYNSLKVGAA